METVRISDMVTVTKNADGTFTIICNDAGSFSTLACMMEDGFRALAKERAPDADICKSRADNWRTAWRLQATDE